MMGIEALWWVDGADSQATMKRLAAGILRQPIAPSRRSGQEAVRLVTTSRSFTRRPVMTRARR